MTCPSALLVSTRAAPVARAGCDALLQVDKERPGQLVLLQQDFQHVQGENIDVIDVIDVIDEGDDVDDVDGIGWILRVRWALFVCFHTRLFVG